MKNRASYEKAAALFPGDFREALLAAASLVVAEFVQSARVESMPKELPRSDRI